MNGFPASGSAASSPGGVEQAAGAPPRSAPRTNILGLTSDEGPTARPPEDLPRHDEREWPLRVSVIVPARNEEADIPACLQSLRSQDSPIFVLGQDWELIVVDDASVDGTRALVGALFAGKTGVRLLEAPALELRDRERAFTGKTNACWFGAQGAQGRWLLFTDADTVHEPGSLQHALGEAERHGVALLSYSPRQVVHGLAQRTVMPLIFAELASVYKPAEVNDPAKRTAAANGQFLLVSRAAYQAVGGHRAVGRSVLEDVDLAVNVKRAKKGVRLRYAPDAVSTEMYRGFGNLVEGWTKNLALLFPHALQLAAWRVLDIALLLLPLLLFLMPWLVLWQKLAIVLLWLRTLLRFYRRTARGNFGFLNTALAPLGLPLFVFLLLNSWSRHKLLHQVSWKGREYRTGR